MSYETLELTRSDGIATLVLDRPQAMNAWDLQLAQELRDAIAEVAADDDVRVLLLTGRGRAFSAGADVKAGFPPTAAGHWDVHTRLIEVHDPIILGLREMPKPVIAVGARRRRRGSAARSRSPAISSSPPSRRTSCSRSSTSASLPTAARRRSSPRAPASAARPRWRCSASRCRRRSRSQWGLANRAVPDDQLDEEALALARRLAAGPTKAYAAAKREFNAWAYSSLRAQLALEADEQQRLARDPRQPGGRRRVRREAPGAVPRPLIATTPTARGLPAREPATRDALRGARALIALCTSAAVTTPPRRCRHTLLAPPAARRCLTAASCCSPRR